MRVCYLENVIILDLTASLCKKTIPQSQSVMFCCARLRLHPQKRTVLGREMKDTMRERRVSAKARRESVKVRKESMRVRRELMKETMRERRAVSRRA